jgi:hypothetical protein
MTRLTGLGYHSGHGSGDTGNSGGDDVATSQHKDEPAHSAHPHEHNTETPGTPAKAAKPKTPPPDPKDLAICAASLLGGYMETKISSGTLSLSSRDSGVAAWAVQMASLIIGAAQAQATAEAAEEPVPPASVAMV